MKKFIVLIILFCAVVLGFFAWFGYKYFFNGETKTIKINGARISVEIADTAQKMNQGLSGRAALSKNQGMLFIYSEPNYRFFWMKDMLIPLDFVWINSGRVVETTQNVEPKDFQPPLTLTSKEKVDMVLEIAAGMVQKLNIRPSDKIEF